MATAPATRRKQGNPGNQGITGGRNNSNSTSNNNQRRIPLADAYANLRIAAVEDAETAPLLDLLAVQEFQV